MLTVEPRLPVYSKYRGKCKEYVDAACAADPTLTPVRGYYHCPSWGKQKHWWCRRADGTVYDPTIDQFPKPHTGNYEEYNGMVTCESCGKEVPEEEALSMGNYMCCSDRCARWLVGV
jgi:hypothetical protein